MYNWITATLQRSVYPEVIDVIDIISSCSTSVGCMELYGHMDCMEWVVGFTRSVSYAISLNSPLYWKKRKNLTKPQTWGSAFILKNFRIEKLHTTMNGGKQYNNSSRSYTVYSWLQLRGFNLLISSTQCGKSSSKQGKKEEFQCLQSNLTYISSMQKQSKSFWG